MVMLKMEEQPQEQNLIEDGEYTGELVAVTEVETQYGASLRLVFKVVGTDYDGRTASIIVKQKLAPGNKLDSILRSLGSEPLELGDALDTDRMMGRRAKVYVETKASRGGSGRLFSNVTKVKPLKASIPQAGIPHPAPPQYAQPAPVYQPAPAPVYQPAPAPVYQPAPTQVQPPFNPNVTQTPPPPIVPFNPQSQPPQQPLSPQTPVKRVNEVVY